MKSTRLITLSTLTALAATALIAVGAALPRQDDGERKAFKDLSPEEQMAAQMKAMELAVPGPEHALLARYEGSFTQEIKFWRMPGAEPTTITGTVEQEMVLGGRYLLSRGKSSYPGMSDTETLGMWGFDRRHGVYTMVGFDTVGTYYVTAAGPYDKQSRSMTLSGTDEDPTMGQQVYDFKMEFIDDDTYRVSIFFHDMFPDGPFKMVQYTQTRVKSDK